MAPLCMEGRPVFGDVTNLAQDALDCKTLPTKVASSKHGPLVTTNRKSRQLTEKMQEMLDDACASDEVMSSMRSAEANALWAAGLLMEVGCKSPEAILALPQIPDFPGFAETLPQAPPTRSYAAWIFGHLIEHVELPEAHWLHAMLIFDMYCLQRPNAPESPSLPALCAAIVRLVKKFDDVVPKECVSTLPQKASNVAQWMVKTTCPHFETWVTSKELNEYEADILRTLGWNIKLHTVQDWMTLLCARLNVFTCNGLKKLLTPVLQMSFLHSRVIVAHCATTAMASTQRVAQGLLCLNLISAHVLPADTFGLTELALPAWGGAAGGQPQCKEESLAFLLDGLQDASGSDLATLKADTHLVNETLLLLRTSN